MLALVNTPTKQTAVELRDVAEPEAAADEVIVAIQAFSLNRGELYLLKSRPEGWRPGQDIAGIVVQTAADGSGPGEGTRIVGLVDSAGWAQRVAVSTKRLAVLPDTVSFAAAATLPVAGRTALRMVRLGGSLLGRRVLITGAAGGVGRFAVQLAALAGAEVTGIVGRPERAAGLRELGAAAVITDIQEADGLFDLILESVGGSSLAAAVRLVAPEGTIIVFGNTSGEDTTINFQSFVGHQGARLTPFFSYLSGSPASFGIDLASLVSLIEEGKLKPHIGLEESWHKLGQTLAALRDRRVNGKAVFHTA
ncbi:MAG: oxidoreductase [Ktedonobacter sp. 13_1_20CM_4_53_7]|nr:MAG: oxidoreductase [Ktedonobacter sp. 13_1_20CM_4_53_7]